MIYFNVQESEQHYNMKKGTVTSPPKKGLTTVPFVVYIGLNATAPVSLFSRW